MRSVFLSAAALVLGLGCAPAVMAQDASVPPTVQTPEVASALAGDFLVVGIGGALVPSYDGSDDYVAMPFPLLQGSFRGIGINPRAGGIALDVINDRLDAPVTFSFGPTVRLRANRDGRVKDDVISLLPDLDTAIEVGPTAGISFPGVLNPYDALSFTADVKWDIAGAHGGMTAAPAVSYVTPLSRGTVALLSVGGEYGDDEFMDYYYTVTPEAAVITGLPAFGADAGFRSVGSTLLLGFDLNGDLQDGGMVLFLVGGYSRMLGDARETPFTSIRGSADQWTGGAGVAYTF
jgi:outer membrane scaffolding protein for murein synthesis (MipA/OmpV family)